jgi:hypothetical protein
MPCPGTSPSLPWLLGWPTSTTPLLCSKNRSASNVDRPGGVTDGSAPIHEPQLVESLQWGHDLAVRSPWT